MSTLTSEERSQLVQAAVETMKTRGRIVIVGASLAGLRGAEGLRKAGFSGPLTIIGDEPHEPYDRPPLSKQVLKGWVPADHTKLPRLRAVDAQWRLGVAATRLDRANRMVHLANGEEIPFDRLLIATGVPHGRGRIPRRRRSRVSTRFAPAMTQRVCKRPWPPSPGACWSSGPASSGRK